ncbi:MAG: GNAT family N-acetyltransferase [Actinobacteria bacterium]|nr:GNAT family N-acetyltransferase [Actinomycetota bacterium]
MSEISRATVSDLAELHVLVEKYRAFYKQPESEKTLSYLEQRLKNDQAVVFIARVDGEAVGFTLLYPTFSTVSLSDIWLLNDLYVDESARGKGIANQLMDVAEVAAKEAGATRVFLRTANDNLPAQALYEGRNWVKDEVFRRYDLIF